MWQSNLTFGTHINNMACMVRKLNGMLRRVPKDADAKNDRLLLSNTLFRPVFF